MKRWLVGAAGLEAATAGALTGVAPTMVLCDAVSTAVISAEAVVKEDLVAEDPATLQAVGDLTRPARSLLDSVQLRLLRHRQLRVGAQRSSKLNDPIPITCGRLLS